MRQLLQGAASLQVLARAARLPGQHAAPRSGGCRVRAPRASPAAGPPGSGPWSRMLLAAAAWRPRHRRPSTDAALPPLPASTSCCAHEVVICNTALCSHMHRHDVAGTSCCGHMHRHRVAARLHPDHVHPYMHRDDVVGIHIMLQAHAFTSCCRYAMSCCSHHHCGVL